MAKPIYKDPRETVFYYLDPAEWQQKDEGVTNVDIGVVGFETERLRTIESSNKETISLSIIEGGSNVSDQTTFDVPPGSETDILVENFNNRDFVTEDMLVPTDSSKPSKWIKPTNKGYRLAVTGGKAGYSYCAIINIHTEALRKEDIYIPIFVRRYYKV